MKWFRVTFKSDTHGYDVKIEFDILRNIDGLTDKTVMFFGYWDDAEIVHIAPIVHRYDNTIDWGSNETSLFPIRGIKLIKGSVVSYSEYENQAAFDRKHSRLDLEFTVTAVRDLTSADSEA